MIDVQHANHRCTGHATMSTERGNYGLITVHAPFLAIGPNQKSLSNCCMKALSHWPEIKNSGRCAPWNFTKKYCTYTYHTLRVYRPSKVLLRPLSKIFLRIPKQYFVFVSSPKIHTVCNNRPNIVDLLYIGVTNCKVAVWFGARKGACTVISQLFALSVDIVECPVQRRFAFCTSWKVSEVIQRSRRNIK